MSIITSDDSKYIAFVKARHSEFLMYDLGPLRSFLENEISSLFSKKYTQDLLARATLTDERTVETQHPPLCPPPLPASLDGHPLPCCGLLQALSQSHIPCSLYA